MPSQRRQMMDITITGIEILCPWCLILVYNLRMEKEEVLKAVFPLLDGKELASCMAVCRQWRDIAKEDYFWKCLCGKRWPSMCRCQSPFTGTYYKLYQTFHKRQHPRALLPPRLSFDDLEFFIDIWEEDKVKYSEVIQGPVFKTGIHNPPPGIPNVLIRHLAGIDYKLTHFVETRFTVPLTQNVSASVLVHRKDTNKVACIINGSLFDYIDRTSYRALAYDYLDFSPNHPFVTNIRAWLSLLFIGEENEGDIFGIEIDFCDAANSKEEVLWLLDILDWK